MKRGFLLKAASAQKANTAPPKGLDLYFSDWETRFANDNDSVTVRIPPCADVEKSSFLNKDKSGINGREAERDFIEKWMNLRIGGILVTGIGSAEFLTAFGLMHDPQKKEFEIDALFLHDKYGIIVFECKAMTLKENQALQRQKCMVKALGQLQKIKIALQAAYKAFNGTKLCCIHSVIVVPNSELNNEEKYDFEKSNSISLWDKKDTHHKNLLQKLVDIKAIIADSAPKQRQALKKFTRKASECRSVTYLSPKQNVLAINNIIERHLLLKSSTAPKQKIHFLYNIGKEPQLVYLDEVQDEILHDSTNFQIISGPPGTGKTLLMLLKILRLARDDDFKHQIIVHSWSKGSTLEMQNFFALNLPQKDHLAKVRLILPGYDQVSDADLNSSNALFMDELFMVKLSNLSDSIKVRKELNCVTFLCISGYIAPGYLTQPTIEQQFHRFTSNKIKYTFLTTVYRGTKNTIETWKSIFDSNFLLKIAHNIHGFAVEEYESGTFNELLEILSDGLKLFSVASSKKEMKFSACAVIVDSEPVLEVVRTFIAAAGIPCGTVLEYVKHPNLVAVDEAENCLSMEWPVVFYIETGVYMGITEGSRFIAKSRAMVKLVTLRWETMKVVEKFREALIEKEVDVVGTSFDDYVKILIETQARVYPGEKEQEIITLCFFQNFLISVIQFDYWPLQLKRYPSYNFASFFDAMLGISRDKNALFKILCIDYKQFTGCMGMLMRAWIEKPDENWCPQFLKTICRQHSSEEIARRWRTCVKLNEEVKQMLETIKAADVPAEMEILQNEFASRA